MNHHLAYRCLLLFIFLVTVGFEGAQSRLAAAERLNVVLIVSDDQGWNDYSFQGHPHIQTPRLDRLAAESRVFTNGYVPSSLCRPSLATILSGLFPHQHKITSNDPPLPPGIQRSGAERNPEFLSQREVSYEFITRVPTLPRILAKQQSFESFQTGKWWEGDFRRGGFTQGMTLGGRHGDAGLKIGRTSMDPILEFIDRTVAGKRPFFVWYAPLLPHSPHTAPEALIAKYQSLAPSYEMARYWACVEWFDQTCGTLLDHLETRNLVDSTLVLYLADNGWLQDLTADRYAPRSKQSPYEGGLRTPIMVRWPGRVKPEHRPELASSIDLAPTILAALGLQPTPEMSGVNLLDDRALGKRDIVFGECFTHNAIRLDDPASSLRWRWCRSGSWKLILPDPVNEPEGEPELFNLTDDPAESRNRAADEPDRVAQLRARLDAWWRPSP